MKPVWTDPFHNPFAAIHAAAIANDTPGDFDRAIVSLNESTNWPTLNSADYLKDLLAEIAEATNIAVQYSDDGTYRAAYSE